MNVLVTGGCGFAGRFIAEYLVKAGHKVTATYRANPINPINPITEVEEIKYVQQDLSEHIDIDDNFNAIVHTACAHSGTILKCVRDNIDSARNLVDYARRKGIPTIIYFSTRSVYGEIRQPEVDETSEIINQSKYGMTKYIAELIFQEATDINTLGFRTPGIIGPGAHDIWLVDVVNTMRRGDDIVISDFNTKNLVHIADISRWINKLIVASANGKTFKYKVVNLSCKETINNLEIAEIVKKRLQSSSKISRAEAKGLFLLNSDRACCMGFKSSSPREIVDSYLDYVCLEDRKKEK